MTKKSTTEKQEQSLAKVECMTLFEQLLLKIKNNEEIQYIVEKFGYRNCDALIAIRFVEDLIEVFVERAIVTGVSESDIDKIRDYQYSTCYWLDTLFNINI